MLGCSACKLRWQMLGPLSPMDPPPWAPGPVQTPHSVALNTWHSEPVSEAVATLHEEGPCLQAGPLAPGFHEESMRKYQHDRPGLPTAAEIDPARC